MFSCGCKISDSQNNIFVSDGFSVAMLSDFEFVLANTHTFDYIDNTIITTKLLSQCI